MKHSKAETKAEVTAAKPAKGPTYPWGLSMSLDHEALAKLGIPGAPKGGTKITLSARGHVKSSNSRVDESGETRHSAEIQITHLGMGADNSQLSKVKTLKSAKTAKAEGPKLSKVKTLKGRK